MSTLNRTVSPALTLIWVANPSMLWSSYESHSLGGVPGRAFSLETVVGVAPASHPSAPRFSPTAPALTAAPLRNDRRPNAPKGAGVAVVVLAGVAFGAAHWLSALSLCPGQAAPPDAT